MLTPLTDETVAGIRNPDLARYARRRLALDREFLDAVGAFGLERATKPEGAEARVARLQELGVFGENDGKSFHTGWISPACVACRMGVDTETFLTSTQCPRKCFFCFNPNQEDYEYFLTHDNDIAQQLMDRFRAGARFRFLGITGGEPLLHYERVLDFLDVAGVLAPDAYTRLYTSGAGLTPARAREMAEAGLDEVRFSIKVEDSAAARERVLETIGESVGVFDAVMVEMPVAPDQVAFMKELLVRLDALGVRGINLLELCFPFHNAGEFAKRGYRIKETPYRIPYDYWYAGGLPIAGSESACLELVAFAAERGLKLGVHYCSLENKLTGQVY
ncbi:MAG: radical SAM protein [Eggerthellaceae bacterium]|nr:radical SAM protein [Eggerthellaceae bacterium]